MSISLSTAAYKNIIEKGLICETQKTWRPNFFCSFLCWDDLGEKNFSEFILFFFKIFLTFLLKPEHKEKSCDRFWNSFVPKWCRVHIGNPECIVCSPCFVQNKGYGSLILYDFRDLKLQNKRPPTETIIFCQLLITRTFLTKRYIKYQ